MTPPPSTITRFREVGVWLWSVMGRHDEIDVLGVDQDRLHDSRLDTISMAGGIRTDAPCERIVGI